MKIYINPRLIVIFLVTYICVGILFNFLIPIHFKSCLKCPAGAFCALCTSFDESTYTLVDVITLKFWVSALLWPLNLFGYLEFLNDIRIGRIVRL